MIESDPIEEYAKEIRPVESTPMEEYAKQLLYEQHQLKTVHD